ncbi:RNA pyrophosphohydrolase [Breoghania sp. L-A4]|uniref:RNA pyrophosphohydrolase n=1 Tax=Breoghania sp. L-A4 TaxID=2304600 RepID=UPI000E360277|nr:RNA pyrophosphohydrolase [Breoghania sp. L-A4]AXS38961.1 RNA pyrophosphohydrolase [Breoghania sp. L-A4]
MSDTPPLTHRPCVGVMLINRDGLVWVGRRMDGPEQEDAAHRWQMPQGGIDKGEDPLAAARRELFEETSVSSISLLAEATDWYSYDLPAAVAGQAWKGKYRGQTQKWFAFRFEGDDSEIDVIKPPHGHKPEFSAWRWEKAENLPQLIIPFKRDVYEKVVATFSQFTA